SLASQTLSYKGMVMPERLPEFYPDLRDSRLSSSVCLFHQRFSTNTEPAWRLAQPFRYLAHNGEINTIQGNRFWAEARAAKWQSSLLPDLQKLRPLVSKSGSDSCTLDNMLEIMLAGGLDMLQAMRLMVPPAWQNVDHMDPEVRAFYEFWGMHMEAWDGPAGIVLCDGRYAACTLDRNGLRPARYTITKDRRLIIASEVGVVPMAPQEIVEHGRLKPGEMLAVDLEHGRLLQSAAIDELLKKRNPCKQWLKDNVDFIGSVFVDRETVAEPMSPEKLLEYEKMFLVTFEERDQIIRVLAETQKEAIGSMGDDTPLAVLSKRPRPLYDYFRQQFAQVTNPPIDPLREQIVMSLETQLGEERNIFTATPDHARRMVMGSPVLSETKFQKVLNIDPEHFAHVRIDLNYPADEKLEDALDRIVKQAADSVRENTRVVILSDRGIKPGHLPVHALLATGAVHHHLVTVGLRCDCNIVVETATARDPHHFACLIGYGATAIYPYLAYECLHDMTRTGELGTDTLPRRKISHQIGRSYRRGIKKGLYKIMSKMGISTIASYRGSQLFEIVGLHDDVVNLCFTGTTSRIQGAGFEQLQAEQNALADTAWDKRAPRDQGGVLKYIDGGEYHAFNPEVVHALQTAVRSDDYEQYKRFSKLVNSREPMVLRDLLALQKTKAIALDKVESIEAITPRFDTAGMSLGALSPEAHEALAIAMNRMGGRSNSGEGGEDTARYNTERASKIKQIASGRFGVTPE
ncbi:MAG TPA: glutamate synthase large subunit, partial [Gammaproteobacteria bacterium]|nr:glutamate synthase large subunit [Gammaproteobacteria bacterium]